MITMVFREPRMGITLMTTDVETTVRARQARYGKFDRCAAASQAIKAAITAHQDVSLRDDQREALEMIATKIGRILCGDPNHADSWHDISGYATLVEKRLCGETI